MMKHRKSIILMFSCILSALQLSAQTVDVDVNWNIKHSVGGVSDFGRERHITIHASLTEPDWNGEEAKMDYLMNDLDVYFGRDNGAATWKFQATTQDLARPNKPDVAAMADLGNWLKSEYEKNTDRLQYEPRQQEMIMGTNPHPTYPTLSWYDNGFTWDGWQPKDIETTAEWVVEYLDLFFERNGDPTGEKMPMYWEVINEPDMALMTGQFMVSSWESLFEYHNLVALGVKDRLGNEAPLVGGMTWGLHDIHVADGLSRYTSNYLDQYLEEPALTFYNEAGYTKWPGMGSAWDQWDKIWQGFVDACGDNMDFYSVHIYDWPQRGMGSETSRMRTGGHTEGLLDIMEWYDVYKYGERTPIVLSEYGSVAGYIDQSKDGLYIDWEVIRPFSSMMMQFLERPDYLVKTMPFTPIKAEWGNYYNADGSLLARYPYTMMDENPDGSDNWEWSGYILWYELWADVEGTRVETKATDMDIQVDAYVNGDHAFLILNNLENTAATINLHEFGLGTGVDSVRIKHLYCENHADYASTAGYGVLDDYTLQTAPGSVTVDPEATMIIRYNFTGSFAPGATLVESKVYGEKLGSGTNPRGGEMFRATGATLTGYINGVNVPSGPAEATLRIAGSFTTGSITMPRDGLDYIRINGYDLPFYTDWRGQEIGNGGYGWLGTLEIPVPISYLQANNTITASFNNGANQYAALSLQIFDYSTAPGRYGETADISVTGMNISESSISVNQQQDGSVSAVISPSSATDKAINWTSSNSSVAYVDPNTGRITGVGAGSATITATTADGGYTDTVTVNVSSSSAVAVEGVRVNPANLTIVLDTNLTSVATVLPVNANNQSVTWSSSNPNVASVNASGIITAVGQGSATVTARTADGGYTDTTSVIVPAPVAVTGVEVSPAAGLLPVGNSASLVATVLPTDAYEKGLSWQSLNTSVATVSADGVVTGVSEGTATIRATTDDGGFTASCSMTVFTLGSDGASLTLEAENATTLGGVTVYDIPSGGQGVNMVEANDYLEFENASIPEDGIYKIEYVIASPNDGVTAAFSLDGTVVAADTVPNTGGWDTYTTFQSAGYFQASAGNHTILLTAGTAAWQWNLDKVIVTKVNGGGTPVNQAPSFSSSTISKSAATEGVAYSGSIAGNASDPEGDTITFSKTSGPAWLSVASNGSLSGTPAAGDVGANSFTVSASATGGSDTATLTITVNADTPNNTAPAFSSSTITKSAATENASYSATISGSATDADGDALTYSKVSGPAWLSVANNGALSGTPGSSDVGANSWSVQVSDGSATDTATLNITVNDDGNGGEDVVLTIEAENFDVNGGVQTYTVGSVSAINWVEANDYVEYNVTVPQSGTYTIDYYISTPLDGSTISFLLNGTTVVTDSVPNNGGWDTFTSATRSSSTVALTAGANTIRLVAGSNAWQWNLDKVVLTTSGAPGNTAPVFGSSTISKAAATENSAYSGTISGSATDADGDSLTYSKASGPAWLSVASNGTLSGTPGAGDVGANSWTVQVSDGTDTDTATLNITVNADTPANTAPAFGSSTISKANATENASYSASISGSATDADGDSLTYSKTSGPAWLSVASNGTLSGTPGAGDVGANSWTVQVSDGTDTDTATLNITVNADTPVNLAPVFGSSTISKDNADENVAYSATISGSATDANGDSLTYSKVSGPAWLSVASNGALSGTPGSSDVGANSWTVQVSDGSLTDTATLNVTVDAEPVSGQTPYGGTARSLASQIEAEDYDEGGEDVAYNDTSAGNSGNSYRTSENVDVQGTSDTGAGYNVGWMSDGEWLEYTVNATAGTYDINLRVASINSGRQLRVVLDGVTLATLDVPNTGGWQAWQTVTAEDIVISGGNNKILRVEVIGNGQNLNWIEFEAVSSSPVNQAPVFGSSSISKDNADEGVAYSATISGSATDADGDSLTYSKVSGPAWLSVASNGSLSGTPASSDVGANSWTVQVSDGTDTDTATLSITVDGASSGPASFTIEAENMDVNGGVQTYTTGGIGAINWVQANDYVEYNVTVPQTGTYNIDYYISTPLDGGTITFQLNGTDVVTDSVPNNGSWDVFTSATRSSSTVNLTAGANTIRLTAGTNAWQWNLDKVVLSTP